MRVASETILRFFFEAMRHGYASGNPPSQSTTETYSEEFVYERNDFKLRDRWLSIPGSIRSSGETTIWHKGVPVWYMSYYGHYSPIAIPALKHALNEMYVVRGEFLGGRGPRFFEHEDGLMYLNNPSERSSFDWFLGTEEIVQRQNKNPFMKHGRHDYMGGRLS